MDQATDIGGNRLAVLAADIRAAHPGMTTATARAIEAGHALTEAKGLLQHGR
jgi:hypothetical protein